MNLPEFTEALEGFLGVLEGAGLELYAEGVLDALWMAAQKRTLSLDMPSRVPAAQGAQPRAQVSATPKPEEPIQPLSGPSVSGRSSQRAIDLPKEPTVPVYYPDKVSGTDQTVTATSVAVSARYALNQRLALARALRPFRQRWSSRREKELDEEQTVEITADLRHDLTDPPGYLYPVFRPVQERWFNAEVVLEDDGAIGLWDDTMREFCQMLRDTGAFRDVRSWRLRLLPVSAGRSIGLGDATLETPAGGRASTRVLAGTGTRRLIFFFSHGSSSSWLDGTYGRILAPWIQASSVVLFHLLPRERWKRTPFGDAHGFCHASQPGERSSTLLFERFWWCLAFEADNAPLLPLPAVPLDEPEAVSNWAHMAMARGRRCPVFLLDLSQPAVQKDEQPDLVTARDFESAVSALYEVSPRAFRLAVYLCSGPFTIPVAKLVQKAAFGPDAKQSDLAEVLLSGLVFATSPRDAKPGPDTLWYKFRPEARAILLRSLREKEAEWIAGRLERHVSQYVQQVYGYAIAFRGLVPDENGKYFLPAEAQPFAELGLSLLGIPQNLGNALQLFQRFCESSPPAIISAAARLAAAASEGPLRPDSTNPKVWRALLDARLIHRNSTGHWVFLPGMEAQFARLGGIKRVFGISTEYGISVNGVETVNVVAESIELVRSYTEYGAFMKWDYNLEDPHQDTRGFPAGPLMQDTDESAYFMQGSGIMQYTDASAYYVPGEGQSPGFEEINRELVLSNGARFFNDHAHPQYSSSECTTLREIIAQDKAGERMLAECVRRRNKKIGPEREVRVYKNNTDFIGHSYGCHENYLMSRAVPWDRLVGEVIPFLITRQIYAGAGKLGTEGEGATGQPGIFQISQRADFFSVLVSIDTMNRRPIVNTRDEPYADPGKYRKFHVIVGDSNMSEFATALKIGIMGLVLELIEKTEAPQLEIAQPVAEIKSISRDQSYSWIVKLEDGRNISALDIQRMYLEKALQYCDRTSREVDWLLSEWEKILNDLEIDVMRCVDRIDWVAKRHLLNTFQEEEKLEWTDPWLRSIDLEYHNIAWEQGLHYQLVREERMRRILREEEIKAAIFNPPESTRAFFRGRAVARFSPYIQTMHWDEVLFAQGGQQYRVSFNHASSDDPRIARFNATIRDAANYGDLIRRLQKIEQP